MSSSASNQFLNPVSQVDLARWGLLDEVRRQQRMDALLRHRPLPGPERLMLFRQELEQTLNLTDQDQRTVWLARVGLSEDDLNLIASRSWQWLMWCRERWGDNLQTIFLERKEEFDRVEYSFLRLLDGELAQELYLKIKEGESSFADMATQFSGGPEKRTGGRLGPVPLSELHPALAKLLRVSKPGQLWPPKKLEGWWLLVRLDKLYPATLTPALQERLLLDEGEKLLDQSLI